MQIARQLNPEVRVIVRTRYRDEIRELRKLGAVVHEFDEGLDIEPRALQGAEIDTYDDHRMAMSFALAGLRTPNLVIRHPECTAKTYPRFFDDLEQLARGSR